MTISQSIVMTRTYNIVMCSVMEHCNEKDVENCEDKGHWALRWQGMEHGDGKTVEHREENTLGNRDVEHHGAL